MEETMTLTDLLAAIARKGKAVILTSLVFAVLLGGYQAYKQIGMAKDPENSPEKIEERYQAALETYAQEQENLQKTLENQEKSLASKKEYLEKSILLQIDPYDKYVSSIVFTFADIDESAQLFRYPNTSADYLPKKIRSQYLELWKSINVPEEIGLARYADMEWKYPSELISVSSLEGELISIQTCGITAAEAEELADAIYAYFVAHQDVIAKSSARHTFALVNRTTKSVIDEELETRRTDLEKEIETLQEEIEDSKQAIEDLTEPERESGYATSAIIKATAKYAVFGAAAGVFLACLVICCWWIFANRVANSNQLEQIVKAPFLGALRVPDSPAERLAVAVMGERTWKDRTQAAAYISEQAKASFPKEGKILLLSTLPEKKADAKMDELIKMFSKGGYQVFSVMDAIYNPQAVEAVHDCAAVVLVEMAGYSSIAKIRNIVAQIEGAKKSMLGIVMI